MSCLIPTRDHGEVVIPEEWIAIWNTAYYDVPRTLQDIRIWCHDNPAKRKTKRGLRAFLGRWIRKTCIKRPAPAVEGSRASQIHTEVVEPNASLASRQSYLAVLKGMVKA